MPAEIHDMAQSRSLLLGSGWFGLPLMVYFPTRLVRISFPAHVAKLADAYVSEAYGATHGGSIPLVSTFSLFIARPGETRPH